MIGRRSELGPEAIFSMVAQLGPKMIVLLLLLLRCCKKLYRKTFRRKLLL